MQGPQFLSVAQVLLTTLVVKLAVMAALATMLVRYRRFRHILIFERRAWPDRLAFALSLGIPLAAGVEREDRKSTRLNSSHGYISYAVFCLKKKKNTKTTRTYTRPRHFRLSL